MARSTSVRALQSLFCVLAASVCTAQQKKRVAILDFDYATVQSGIAAIFGTNVDVGRGVADLLVDRLVTSGVYSVIERKALDQVLREQNFSNSDRSDAATAAKIGRILGVEAIIIGSITQFGRDDKATSLGGSALGGISRKYGLGVVQMRQAKAVVGLSARMVSIDTAEILAVAGCKGESTRSGTSLLGAGGSSGGAAGGVYDMRSSNFAGTILGEATHQAVAEVAKSLDRGAGRLPTRTVSISGLVADATGNTLVLNVGSRAGLKVGDRLEVRRKTRDIRDPATGKVIRSIEEKLGEVVITEVDELSSVGTYSGTSAPKVGDAVKNVP